MKKFNEQQETKLIMLSNHQKIALTKIFSSNNPIVAYGEVMFGDEKLITATQLLEKMGAVTIGDKTVEITEYGKEIMKDNNLIDESETLTSEGVKYLQMVENYNLIKSINSNLSV